MHVSIIICTYNRSRSLLNTLESIDKMKVPAGILWEVIVIDNNSSDNTQEKVLSYNFNNHPVQLRYIKEENQGVAFARNLGIQESTGEIIVFMDDDEVADTLWLAKILEPFNTNSADCVGGKILVKYPEGYKKPVWLLNELEGFIGKLDYGGEKPMLLDNPETPVFTGNSAFSRRVFKEAGLFNTQLGRRGTQTFGGEDVEMSRRILKAGFSIFYQPEAVVYHIIGQDKLKKNYFRKLHFFEGEKRGYFIDQPPGKNIIGIPLYIFPQFIRSIFRYLNNPTLRLQMNIWWHMGFIKGRMESCFSTLLRSS